MNSLCEANSTICSYQLRYIQFIRIHERLNTHLTIAVVRTEVDLFQKKSCF
jgi:hypothetical protein